MLFKSFLSTLDAIVAVDGGDVVRAVSKGRNESRADDARRFGVF